MNVLFNKLIRFIDVERERTPRPTSRSQIVLLVRWKRADGSLMAREISRVQVPKAADTAHTHIDSYKSEPGNPPAAARKRVVPDI